MGERVFAIANFFVGSVLLTSAGTQRKDCFGATPKPARETRALPTFRLSGGNSSDLQ
jgi:hypothetical protein